MVKIMKLKVLNFKPPFYYKICCEIISLLVLPISVTCIKLPSTFLYFFCISKKNHEYEDHISLIAAIGHYRYIYTKFLPLLDFYL